MQRAKAFFFVCAGVFLLALAYHLGAVSVRAQGASTVEAGEFAYRMTGTAYGFVASGVVGRSYHWLAPSGAIQTNPVPIPGTAQVIATNPDLGVVMLANGDIFEMSGADWRLVTNLAGAPTPAAQPTFGQLKAQYRK